MSKKIPAWTQERADTLINLVGAVGTVVTRDQVANAATTLETSDRSISSKLRKIGYEVESASSVSKKVFSDAQEEELLAFITSNPAQYTYAEIATSVCGGEFSAKQVQGKILSMEENSKVKETPKLVVAKSYTDAEEAKLIELVNSGSFIEEIAAALGKEVNSVRGKCLSLRSVIPMPKQRESHAKVVVDALSALGDISESTIEQIAESIDKSVRGVKVMLTRRGLTCKDYDGAARAVKIQNNKDVGEAEAA